MLTGENPEGSVLLLSGSETKTDVMTEGSCSVSCCSALYVVTWEHPVGFCSVFCGSEQQMVCAEIPLDLLPRSEFGSILKTDEVDHTDWFGWPKFGGRSGKGGGLSISS